MDRKTKDIISSLELLDEISQYPGMRKLREAREKQIQNEAARIASLKEESLKIGIKIGIKRGREEVLEEIILDLKPIINDYFDIGLSVDQIISKPSINKYLSKEDVLKLEREIKKR